MDAFYGEIRAFPYTFSPQGWLPCDGRQLQISAYQPLFAVIGITYGGSIPNKVFNLPDLRGQAVLGTGQGLNLSRYEVGNKVGAATETLTISQTPIHDHTLQTQGNSTRLTAPGATALALNPQFVSGTTKTSYKTYIPSTATPALGKMAPQSLTPAGGNQPHSNLSPYLVIGWYICVENGYFPVRP